MGRHEHDQRGVDALLEDIRFDILETSVAQGAENTTQTKLRAMKVAFDLVRKREEGRKIDGVPTKYVIRDGNEALLFEMNTGADSMIRLQHQKSGERGAGRYLIIHDEGAFPVEKCSAYKAAFKTFKDYLGAPDVKHKDQVLWFVSGGKSGLISLHEDKAGDKRLYKMKAAFDALIKKFNGQSLGDDSVVAYHLGTKTPKRLVIGHTVDQKVDRFGVTYKEKLEFSKSDPFSQIMLIKTTKPTMRGAGWYLQIDDMFSQKVRETDAYKAAFDFLRRKLGEPDFSMRQTIEWFADSNRPRPIREDMVSFTEYGTNSKVAFEADPDDFLNGKDRGSEADEGDLDYDGQVASEAAMDVDTQYDPKHFPAFNMRIKSGDPESVIKFFQKLKGSASKYIYKYESGSLNPPYQRIIFTDGSEARIMLKSGTISNDRHPFGWRLEILRNSPDAPYSSVAPIENCLANLIVGRTVERTLGIPDGIEKSAGTGAKFYYWFIAPEKVGESTEVNERAVMLGKRDQAGVLRRAVDFMRQMSSLHRGQIAKRYPNTRDGGGELEFNDGSAAWLLKLPGQGRKGVGWYLGIAVKDAVAEHGPGKWQETVAGELIGDAIKKQWGKPDGDDKTEGWWFLGDVKLDELTNGHAPAGLGRFERAKLFFDKIGQKHRSRIRKTERDAKGVKFYFNDGSDASLRKNSRDGKWYLTVAHGGAIAGSGNWNETLAGALVGDKVWKGWGKPDHAERIAEYQPYVVWLVENTMSEADDGKDVVLKIDVGDDVEKTAKQFMMDMSGVHGGSIIKKQREQGDGIKFVFADDSAVSLYFANSAMGRGWYLAVGPRRSGAPWRDTYAAYFADAVRAGLKRDPDGDDSNSAFWFLGE